MGRFRLLDSRLRLDPQIEAQMRRFSQGEPAPRFRHLVLHPNWQALSQPDLQRIMRPGGGGRQATVPRREGPAQPRPGEATDVLRAIYAVPAVQEAVRRVLDQAAAQLRRQWAQASTGERAAAITGAAVISAGALAGVLSHSETRRMALDAMSNTDIPVPGLSGLGLRISPRPDNWGATITFDIQEFLRSLE